MKTGALLAQYPRFVTRRTINSPRVRQVPVPVQQVPVQQVPVQQVPVQQVPVQPPRGPSSGSRHSDQTG
jgi:hypothetical protein